MAENAVAQFFAKAYSDRSLQGALNYALVKASPDTVVEIARQKGYQFSAKELDAAIQGSEELSEAQLSGVAGGALSNLSSLSLQTNFWGLISRPGGTLSGFQLTIPGPSFVKVAASEAREPAEINGAQEAPPVSAADVYQGLLAE